MATIFLSYSRKDREMMHRVKRELIDAGVSVWTDENLRPGTEVWERDILETLQRCDGVVVLLSPDSAKSEWVLREVTIADEFDKPIFPLLISGTKKEATILRLSTFQQVDLCGNFKDGMKLLLGEFGKRKWLNSSHSSELTDVQKLTIFEQFLSLPKYLIITTFLVILILFALIFRINNSLVEGSIFGFIEHTKIPTNDEGIITPNLQPIVTQKPFTTPSITPEPSPTYYPGESNLNSIDDAIYNYIPVGEFSMGSDNGIEIGEEPAHVVFIDPFWIGETEVTNQQFSKFLNVMEGEGYNVLDWIDSESTQFLLQYSDDQWEISSSYKNLPVVNVNWYGAMAYCNWAGGRLPTEAEWEKAARGGLEGKQYPWGDQYPDCGLGTVNGAWFGLCGNGPIPVKSYSPNEYGLFDMAGNVMEWVSDWYSDDYYDISPYENPLGPEKSDQIIFKVLRSGAFGWHESSLLTYRRLYFSPGVTDRQVGFRCVLPIDN